jgi:hypothetical protein
MLRNMREEDPPLRSAQKRRLGYRSPSIARRLAASN